jgi:hypothetical protein
LAKIIRFSGDLGKQIKDQPEGSEINVELMR